MSIRLFLLLAVLGFSIIGLVRWSIIPAIVPPAPAATVETGCTVPRPNLSPSVVRFRGLEFHVDPDDMFITGGTIAFGGYEPVLTREFLKHVQPRDTVIDIGANIGYYTLLGAQAVGPKGRVYAFEPDPSPYALMSAGIQANGFKNVTAEQVALSDQAGVVTLYRDCINRGDNRIITPRDQRVRREAVQVRALRLDDYLPGDTRIAFIKSDTQGADGMVLEGARRTITRQDSMWLAVEFWPYGLHRAGWPPERFLMLLYSLGFRQIWEIDERKGTMEPTTIASLVARSDPAKEEHADLLLRKP